MKTRARAIAEDFAESERSTAAKNAVTTITKLHTPYGAPMGRAGHGGNVDEPLYLRRVPLDSGGYDSGGAYWGIGAPLFECFNETGDFTRYLRAGDRERAKAQIRADYPDAQFHR